MSELWLLICTFNKLGDLGCTVTSHLTSPFFFLFLFVFSLVCFFFFCIFGVVTYTSAFSGLFELFLKQILFLSSVTFTNPS